MISGPPELEIFGGPSAGAANAKRAWNKRRGLLLRLRSGPRVGLGEASPLPNYSPDSFEDVKKALGAWRPDQVTREVVVEAGLENGIQAVRRAVATIPADLPSARFAAEIALLDLLGQKLRLSLAELLLRAELELRTERRLLPGPERPFGPRAGASPAPTSERKNLAAILTDAANAALLPLDLEDEKATLLTAAELLARGFRHLKVKIGRPGRFDEESRQLRLLRRMHGDSWQLRLDANGALDPSDIHRCLDTLAEVAPEFLEEPLPWPALGAISESPIPLAVDESLVHGWSALEEWLHAGPCAAVVLKPLVLGGVLPCLGLARRARDLGLATVASHGFDGPVALQATASLALALDALADWPVAHGTARHAGLDAWPAVQGENGARRTGGGSVVEGARLRADRARPGLGIRF